MSVLADQQPIPRDADGAPRPSHVAIIMDGNGRWAKARGLPRVEGHRRGVVAVRETVRAAIALEIPYLTLFSFSSENWTRPRDEVDFLFGLFRRYIRRDVAELHAEGVRIRIIGNRAGMPDDIRAMIEDAERLTAENKALTLVFAFNYGARDEIVRAAQALAVRVASGELVPEDIDGDVFGESLDTAGIPDPDLIIRTSGEKRLSNFLLWQSAYAELVFSPVYWPDFGADAFSAALVDFSSRTRRFGGIGA